MNDRLRYDPFAARVLIPETEWTAISARLDGARQEVLDDVDQMSSPLPIPAEKQPLDAGFINLPAQLLKDRKKRGQPSLLHCFAGKDRTGMVAALVLSLVGVPDEVIVEDYTLTDARMVLVMERIRAAGGFPETATPLPPSVSRAEAASMETFLVAVREQHGSVDGWARSAGISDDTLAALREVLVDHG